MRRNLPRSSMTKVVAGLVISLVLTFLTGISQIDALAGGIPQGALTEICGPVSMA